MPAPNTRVQRARSASRRWPLMRWAPRSPSPDHPYGATVGRTTYYYAPPVGWVVENELWLLVGLLAVLALVMWIHREDVHRVR